jgi:phosphatidate cytidylyltransferase
MHPVVYYTIFFAIVGAIGMAAANRKAEKKVRRARWLKYSMYILITGAVITSIGYHFFDWVAVIIAAISFIELVINNTRRRPGVTPVALAMLVFLIVVAGFIMYATVFIWSFLLFIYFQVLVFDGFCQVVGQLWGRHPLAPAISPTKTSEGLAGGWFCCIVAAILASSWIHISIIEAALYGLLTGFVSFCGDLSASYYKRKLQIKDYSNWLPGQGGFLDRFDSLLATGFIYYLLYISIFKTQFSDYIIA